MKIIFAQGNPDRQYAKTRHNTGFLVLDAYGETHNALWKDSDKFNARIAELSVNSEKVLLVKPSSFYNDTGTVARKLLDFYKADPKTDFLVIHDDLALPFGTIRIREKGSDAGNNGIKSLNTYIGSEFSRIRIGIWTELRDRMDDVNFVLGTYSKEEEKRLKKDIIPHIMELIHAYLEGNLEATSHSL